MAQRGVAVASLDLDRLPKAVRSIAARLGSAGHGAWVVGGCVRDLLRGAPVSDWDLATSAKPNEVRKLFPRTIPTGIQHGTVTVMDGATGYEVTTLRGEGAYSDGRRPDSVHFVGSIEEDLARRDFTINAIALDPTSGVIVDPWAGVVDLEARLIRAVRDPGERFAEDGLRALRAARFVATLEMDLDPSTEAAIGGALETLAKVSRERVLQEWQKALEKSRAPSRAFAVMRRTGMLGVVAAPLAALSDEAFARALARLDAVPRTFAAGLAALLLETRLDRKPLDAWLRELKVSNADRERVLQLVTVLGGADLTALGASSDVEVRRWTRRIGRAFVDDALLLAHAAAPTPAAVLEPRVREALGAPLEISELAVRGEDLMRELGVPPSRTIGVLLEGLLDDVLEDPSRNTRDMLLARARSRLPG
jgi:tRNA nucleotidyltransferase (CCA-adding enzyme)